MKKTLALGLILMAMPVMAADVWRSSNTATNQAGVGKLCESTQKGFLHGICTSFGAASSSTTIVNSTFTIVGKTQVGPVSTFVADQCKYYDVMLDSGGMGFHKPNTAVVTIMYSCH